jgi:hypothetical protein
MNEERVMKVEYSSNNSGGDWWLTDEDWLKLEEAGWVVDWVKNQEPGLFHKKGEERWLGALAKRASIEVPNLIDALRSFEKVTGQRVSDEGCNCCGAPHSFNWRDEKGNYQYVSGEDCLQYLYPDAESFDLRGAYERIYGGVR